MQRYPSNLIVSYEHLEQWEDAYNTAKTYVSKYPEDTKGQEGISVPREPCHTVDRLSMASLNNRQESLWHTLVRINR